MNSLLDGLDTAFSTVSNWAKQPFSETMDLGAWALFVGLIIVLAISWNFVLRDLKGAV